jgi:hypothetical protein
VLQATGDRYPNDAAVAQAIAQMCDAASGA